MKVYVIHKSESNHYTSISHSGEGQIHLKAYSKQTSGPRTQSAWFKRPGEDLRICILTGSPLLLPVLWSSHGELGCFANCLSYSQGAL